MKSLFFVLGCFISLSVAAQKHISVNQDIDDNGKQLSIKVKGTINGKAVDYSRVFDVSGMAKEQKDALKERVFDSLGLPMPVAPLAPLAPATPRAIVEPIAPVEVNSPVPVITAKSEYADIYIIGGDHPFTKETRYNPKTGLLYMKYRFIKNGEEITVEKSVDAKDKSKEEKDQIIKKYEKEIGVLQTGII
jgi:hypothetical protein